MALGPPCPAPMTRSSLPIVFLSSLFASLPVGTVGFHAHPMQLGTFSPAAATAWGPPRIPCRCEMKSPSREGGSGDGGQGGGWICRRMREQDIPRVVLLDQQCYGPMGLWTADMYAEEVNGERSEIVVLETRGATVGSEIVGVCALSHVLDEGSITNVAVSPYSRRQGLGSMVLSGMLQRARRLNLGHLYLEVRADSNPAAVALYRRFGFEDVGRRKRYYAPVGEAPGADREDALILSRGEIGQSEVEEWRGAEWGRACRHEDDD